MIQVLFISMESPKSTFEASFVFCIPCEYSILFGRLRAADDLKMIQHVCCNNLSSMDRGTRSSDNVGFQRGEPNGCQGKNDRYI